MISVAGLIIQKNDFKGNEAAFVISTIFIVFYIFAITVAFYAYREYKALMTMGAGALGGMGGMSGPVNPNDMSRQQPGNYQRIGTFSPKFATPKLSHALDQNAANNGNGAYVNNVRPPPSANNNPDNFRAFHGQGVRLGGN